jgi:hypothetical protein
MGFMERLPVKCWGGADILANDGAFESLHYAPRVTPSVQWNDSVVQSWSIKTALSFGRVN